MISIVICSAKSPLDVLTRNISETIGVQHEIILIENINARFTIAQAYNIGIRKASYDIICFLHDDIRILSNNWGIKAIQEFKSNPQLGLIGVIGTEYKSIFPTPWTCPDIDYNKGTLWQCFKHEHKDKVLINYSEGSKHEVAVVDGVFLITSKTVLEQVGNFDENLKGFHCYDIDLAMKLYQQNIITLVVPYILIEHYSEGKLNNDWLENQLYLMKKWGKLLPANTREAGKINMEIERFALKRSLYAFTKNKFSMRTRLKYILFLLTFDRIPKKDFLTLIGQNIHLFKKLVS